VAARRDIGRGGAELSVELACIRPATSGAAPLPCVHSQTAQERAGRTMQIGSINAQIAQAVSRLKAPAPAAGTPGAGGTDFLSSLDSALKSVSRNQLGATEMQRQFQLENPNVSLEQTMIAMNQASISFQAAVQVRNRLVQAYEQVMNMPV
jgi:flagellar hook-basal body complex protein FliE